jgi:hypothetical protein
MSDFPDTTRRKTRRGASPFVYVAISLAALALFSVGVLSLAGDEGSVPGEQVFAAGIEDIAASPEDAPFPGSDAASFEVGTRAVRIYLRVEDAPGAERMVATVERSGRSSALGRLFGGPGVRAEDGGNGRLTVSDDGASGVVWFVVRSSDGGALSPGDYAVEVRSGSGGEAGGLVAREYFRIGDQQT